MNLPLSCLLQIGQPTTHSSDVQGCYKEYFKLYFSLPVPLPLILILECYKIRLPQTLCGCIRFLRVTFCSLEPLIPASTLTPLEPSSCVNLLMGGSALVGKPWSLGFNFHQNLEGHVLLYEEYLHNKLRGLTHLQGQQQKP